MLGREPISTMPINAHAPAQEGEAIALVSRDRSGPLFVVVDFSASYLKSGRE